MSLPADLAQGQPVTSDAVQPLIMRATARFNDPDTYAYDIMNVGTGGRALRARGSKGGNLLDLSDAGIALGGPITITVNSATRPALTIQNLGGGGAVSVKTILGTPLLDLGEGGLALSQGDLTVTAGRASIAGTVPGAFGLDVINLSGATGAARFRASDTHNIAVLNDVGMTVQGTVAIGPIGSALEGSLSLTGAATILAKNAGGSALTLQNIGAASVVGNALLVLASNGNQRQVINDNGTTLSGTVAVQGALGPGTYGVLTVAATTTLTGSLAGSAVTLRNLGTGPALTALSTGGAQRLVVDSTGTTLSGTVAVQGATGAGTYGTITAAATMTLTANNAGSAVTLQNLGAGPALTALSASGAQRLVVDSTGTTLSGTVAVQGAAGAGTYGTITATATTTLTANNAGSAVTLQNLGAGPALTALSASGAQRLVVDSTGTTVSGTLSIQGATGAGTYGTITAAATMTLTGSTAGSVLTLQNLGSGNSLAALSSGGVNRVVVSDSGTVFNGTISLQGLAGGGTYGAIIAFATTTLTANTGGDGTVIKNLGGGNALVLQSSGSQVRGIFNDNGLTVDGTIALQGTGGVGTYGALQVTGTMSLSANTLGNGVLLQNVGGGNALIVLSSGGATRMVGADTGVTVVGTLELDPISPATDGILSITGHGSIVSASASATALSVQQNGVGGTYGDAFRVQDHTSTAMLIVNENAVTMQKRLVVVTASASQPGISITTTGGGAGLSVAAGGLAVAAGNVALSNGVQLVSSMVTGTAPFSVASTTKVANLNVDLLDGLDGSQFMRSDANTSTTGTLGVTGTLTISGSSSNLDMTGGGVLKLYSGASQSTYFSGAIGRVNLTSGTGYGDFEVGGGGIYTEGSFTAGYNSGGGGYRGRDAGGTAQTLIQLGSNGAVNVGNLTLNTLIYGIESTGNQGIWIGAGRSTARLGFFDKAPEQRKTVSDGGLGLSTTATLSVVRDVVVKICQALGNKSGGVGLFNDTTA